MHLEGRGSRPAPTTTNSRKQQISVDVDAKSEKTFAARSFMDQRRLDFNYSHCGDIWPLIDF